MASFTSVSQTVNQGVQHGDHHCVEYRHHFNVVRRVTWLWYDIDKCDCPIKQSDCTEVRNTNRETQIALCPLSGECVHRTECRMYRYETAMMTSVITMTETQLRQQEILQQHKYGYQKVLLMVGGHRRNGWFYLAHRKSSSINSQ